MNGRRPPTCTGFLYTVQPGDTMFFIARRFGISLDSLIAANPQIADPNLIFPGDILCIPTLPPPVPPVPGRRPAFCPSSQLYTVQSGDTMFLIAQRFGIPLEALILANPQITDPNLIFPGDVLCIPRKPPVCPSGNLYVVKSGDTMFLIAQRFGVSLSALIAANPQITDPNLIYPGDVLCIPVAVPPEVCCFLLYRTNDAPEKAAGVLWLRILSPRGIKAFIGAHHLKPPSDYGADFVAYKGQVAFGAQSLLVPLGKADFTGEGEEIWAGFAEDDTLGPVTPGEATVFPVKADGTAGPVVLRGTMGPCV